MESMNLKSLEFLMTSILPMKIDISASISIS
jgi:hypothetical protein